MANITVKRKITISPSEAANGTKKLLTRRGKHIEVTIPAGVKTGTLVKLSGGLQITDGFYGDILIQIKVRGRPSKSNNSEIQNESSINLIHKANWFQRHLNWTFIFASAIFYGLTFGGGLLVGFILVLRDPYVTEETVNNVGILVNIVIAILFLLPISGWILDQKGRSLWNLIFLIIPFGVIIFLCLGNRRMGNLETNTGTDLIIRKHRISGKWVVSLMATISAIIIIGSGTLIAISALIPDKPTHTIAWQEVESNSIYWNTNWRYLDAELKVKVNDVANKYFQTHTYIANETDCNDMAIDIWNMLHTEAIKSVIVIGNLSLNGELLNECDHAWLLIFNSEGYSFALETTEGMILFAEDIEFDPQIEQYWEGFLYDKPSDLKSDTRWRW